MEGDAMYFTKCMLNKNAISKALIFHTLFVGSNNLNCSLKTFHQN